MKNINLSNGYVTSLDSLKSVKSLIDHNDLDNLIGKLMQYIEATFTDIEQRNAHKGLVKSICRNWLSSQYEWQDGWKVTFNVNPKDKETPIIEYIIGGNN